ncbi:MAG: trypsin-like peptidase domain-containing protein [Oscillospiraceae bacterium]|nr:trypsin-like peptidase domain-containing protein [Oscillospiraceae bacterium]
MDENINKNFSEENQDNFNSNFNSQEPEIKDKFESENSEYNNNFNKDYEWNFEKYNQMNLSSKEKSNKNKGSVVFASIFGSLVAVPILAFGGIKLSQFLSDITTDKNNSLIKNNIELKISSGSTSMLKNDDGVTAAILDNAYANQPATKIAKKLIPSVVSVVPYIRQQSFYQTGITEAGNASGIIMSSDGYIITNAHAVLKTSSEVVDAIKVILHDNKEYEARIIGVDYNTDLAIVKIDANNLPAAVFGDSDALEVGEAAFAIGSPSGIEFAGSMTAGIISALDRTLDYSSTLGSDNKYIQTDVAINGGNSGGALVNIKGQVIGINARKVSGVGVEGMGFAIPITGAKPIIDDLIKYGYVKGRVKLGIVVEREIDEFISKLNDIKTGLLISSVEANPDLVSKDIRQYDVLHSIDNTKITSVQELKDLLKKYKPGNSVNLVFYRYDTFGNNGRKIEVTARLIEDKGIVINNKNQSR